MSGGAPAGAAVPSAFVTVVDQNGANDVPGQQDLTQLGRDDSDPSVYRLFWSWDDTTDWQSSGNTGDACALFDSNNDGFTDFEVCGQIFNPNATTVTQTTSSPTAWSCVPANNNATDRCQNPTQVPITGTTVQAGTLTTPPASPGASPPGNLITNTDPFVAGANDSTLEVVILKSFLPAGAVLTNVCAHTSIAGGANNNPTDCIAAPGSGLLVIKKDAGTDSTTPFVFTPNPAGPQATITVNGSGQSNPTSVPIGTNSETVTEAVPSNWTLTAGSCKLADGTTSTGTFSSANHQITGITIQSGLVTTCTFTDVNKPALTLIKENDANHDTTYSDSETIPGNASYPYKVTYKLTITNGAASAATISAITDNVVSGTLSSTVGSPSCSTLIGTTINAGQTLTCYYDTTFAGPGQAVVNTASVTLTNGAGSDTKTDTSTVNFTRVASLDLVKTASTSGFSTPPAAGDKIHYSFKITNTGNVTLTSVNLTDALVGLSNATCGATSLAPGANTTCTADYTLTQTDVNAGTVHNSGTACGTPPSGVTPSPACDTDTTDTPIPRVASLDLVKSASTSNFHSPPKAGDTIHYSFSITNTGNVTLTSVNLDDALIGYTNQTCGATTLAPGATTSCTADYALTQTDINAGTVHNSGTACGTPPAGVTPNPACDTDTTDTSINVSASIDLVKTASTSGFSTPPKAGDKINYSFLITNTGNVTLTGVNLDDALVGYTNHTCGATTLAPGASTTCTADYTLTQDDVNAGTVHNSGTACGTPPAGATPNPACDTDTTDTSITRVASLDLVKTATSHFGSPPKAGDKITYDFSITNTGNVTLTGVELTDALIAYSNATCGATTLAPGASTTCSADYTLTQTDVDAGTVHNSGTACGTPPAGATPNPACDTDTTDTPISRTASLDLVKTASTSGFSTPPKAGDKIHYSFSITNTGNTTLTGVTLTDALLGFNNVTCGGVTTLAPGASTTCTADYTLTQADVNAGTVHNSGTACGTPPSGVTPSPACDTDTTDTPIATVASLDLVKSATPDFGSPPKAGDTIHYSFLITNTSNVTLTSVQLTDALVGFNNATCGGVTSLAPGASTTCTADYTLTQADVNAGTVHNSATACGTPPAGVTPNPACDTDTTDTPITRSASLDLVKSATPQFSVPPKVGDTIHYSFSITNTGNTTLTGVELTDALVGFSNAICGQATLEPTKSTTCTADYTLTQDDVNAGTVHNSGTACGTPPAGVTPSPACDTDTTDTPIARSPSLDLVKSATPKFSTPPKAGDTIHYSFSITNTGNVTLSNVNLDDALVGFSSVTCGQTTLAPTESTTCAADYTLTQDDVNAGTVHNSGTACGTSPAGSNACDTDTTDTPISQVASLDLVKSAVPEFSVPPKAGDTIQYSFSITNTGNVTLTAVQLTDALLGFNNVTCGGVTSLAPGASTTCTGDHTLTQDDVDAGTVHNSGTACGTPPAGVAPNPACDTDTTDTPISRAASLDLVKSATPQFSVPPKAGDTIHYSFSITNTGNTTLTGVDLTDALVGFDHVTCGGVTSLAPGASTTCTADYTLTQADVNAGTVHNSGTACGTPPAGVTPSPACDTDTTDTPITQVAALDLVKSATPQFSVPPKAGDTIHYSFSITNTGNTTLTGVELTDALVGFSNAICGQTTLEPTKSTTCTADYTLTQADVDAGTVHNSGTACGTPPAGVAPNPACDTDTTDTPITRSPSLDLVKSAAAQFSSPPKAGDTIHYSFSITNTGNVTLTSVDLDDALLGYLNVTCGKTTLAPTESATCTADYTLKQGDVDAGTVHNSGTACGTPPSGSDACDTDTTDTPISRAASLDLVKSATPQFGTPPKAGDTIHYSFSITNTGNVTLTAVQLTDALVGFSNATCGGVSTLAPGASTTCTADYTLTQADVNSGNVHNSGTACGTPPAGVTPNPACDTDTTDTPISGTASLDLVKTGTPQFNSPPKAGDTIHYSFSITNTGNVTLTAVQLTDALVGFSNATCGVSTLAPTASTTCSADYTLTQADVNAGTVHNSATACGTPPSGPNACDTDTTDTPIAQTKSLDLVKSATPHFTSPPKAGDTITYNFSITNTGNVTLTGVELTDALVGFSNATCGAVTTLAPGATTTCTATYTLTQADVNAGTVHNSGTACGTPPSGPNACDTDTTDTPITRSASLDLVKSATPQFSSPPKAGDTIHYSFSIKNTGNVTLTSVNLTDALIGFSNATCGATTLAPGATTTCSADYTLTQADVNAGTVHNSGTACGTPPASVTPSPACDTDTTDTPITRSAALDLVKSATPQFSSPPKAGDTIHYSFSIKNTGNVTLTSVNLTDALIGFSNATCGATTLAPGATTTCSADYTLTQADVNAGTVHNSGTACGTPPASVTPSPACDTDTTDTPIAQTKSLDLVKSAAAQFSSPPKAGDTIHYSFSITNTGNVTLTAVNLTDALVGFSNATCGAVTTLAPGASTTCSADYTLTQADVNAGTVHNSGTACGTPPSGPNACDADTTDTPITRVTSLDLVKTATPHFSTPPKAGDTITYNFSIKNTGNVTLTGVALTDALVGFSNATCGATTLAPGATTTCSATYTLKQADVDAGNVHNSGTACGTPPAGVTPSPACDTDTTDTPITRSPALSLTKTANPVTYFAVGNVITYTYTLKNTGNVTLKAPFAVTDDKTTVTCPSSPTTVAPGATITCTGTYTIQAGDLNSTITGSVTNHATATAKDPQNNTVTSNPAQATVRQVATTGKIAPTATSCSDFTAGTAADLTDLFYGVQRNAINSVSPGVLFYYSAITAPSASFTITVTESNNLGWQTMNVQNGQAILYNADCTKSSAQGQTRDFKGVTTIQVSGATTGATYIIGIKYSPNDITGQKVSAPLPTATYSWVTAINATTIPQSADSVQVHPR